jgi:hypothetical protein
VSTLLGLYPSEEIAIVVLINKSSGAAAGRIAAAIAAAALPGTAPRTATGPATGTVGAANPSLGAELAGTWRGHVIAIADTLPLTITVQRDGSARVQLGAQNEVGLLGATLARTGWFTGRFSASIRPPDATPAADRERVAITVSLRQRDDRLTGWVSAITVGQPAYGAVSYRAELTRAGAARD